MEIVKSEGNNSVIHVRYDKFPAPAFPRPRLQVWFIWVCSSILLWTCLVQLMAVGELWHPKSLYKISNPTSHYPFPAATGDPVQSPPPLIPSASESHVSLASWSNVCMFC